MQLVGVLNQERKFGCERVFFVQHVKIVVKDSILQVVRLGHFSVYF